MRRTAAGAGGSRPRWVDLSEREGAVLADLARVRLLTGRMVQRLHLHEGSPLTQARRTRALLQRLNDQQLVTRLERRIGGVAAGSAGFVYGLAPHGQRLTTERGPAGGIRLRRPWEPTSQFTGHVLAVSELYVQLREAVLADGDCELVGFDAEPRCWRQWTGPHGERCIVKPDAFVSLVAGEFERRIFAEVDLSTESTTVLLRKALVYVEHFRAGIEQAREGIYPLVLWIVPDERRKRQLVGVLARVPAEFWRLFMVVTVDGAIDALIGRPPPQAATA